MNVRHETKRILIHLFNFVLFGCARHHVAPKHAKPAAHYSTETRRKFLQWNLFLSIQFGMNYVNQFISFYHSRDLL